MKIMDCVGEHKSLSVFQVHFNLVWYTVVIFPVSDTQFALEYLQPTYFNRHKKMMC